MDRNIKQKLTLHQPAIYEVKVPGYLDQGPLDWVGEMAIETGSDDTGLPITTLIATVDQAALHGLLRRLYSMGLPLISVTWVIDD